MPSDGEFELVTLPNGARAVRHRGHGEVMHPSIGPWQEARALYVGQSRLAELLQREGPALRVWDVGLGAGTNAVAALTCARELGALQRRPLHIVSFELDLAPLRLALGDAPGFPFLQPFLTAAQTLVEAGEWQQGLLHWELHLGNALAHWSERAFELADLVYYDPFSPASNPSMWTPDAFRLLRRHTRRGGEGCSVLTYSAATPTRVSLLLGGFFVGTGDATGLKTETTVAQTERAQLQRPLDRRWLARWERSSAQAPHGQALDPQVGAAIREHAQFCEAP